LLQGHDTRRVRLAYALIEARLIQPNVASCEAGRVDGTDRRQHVIEAALADTERGEDSTGPVPAGGAERNAIDEPR
jgi:hypothetical protein